ncbi:MAG: ABC transporter permease [Desulfobacterales bacterium SG8_35_2]|jgi:multiple sugar transport system permease protein|nr:MAG: ABC transporter permease [Desulfobacterales bacterium SG8_35_2]
MILSLQERERAFGLILIIPTFLFVVIFSLYPIIYSFYLSFHRIILGLPGLGQKFVGFQNYIDLFHDRIALHSMFNTLAFVFVSTLCEIILGLIIALVIHQQFKGRGAVRAAVLVPWAIPTVVASQMWRFLFNDKYGLINFAFFGSDITAYRAWLADPFFAFCAIIFADVWKTSSFAALLILAGLQTIPDELYKAAKIDGASGWQRFTHITLPLIKPALLIALLFRTMDALRIFDLVFVMTQGGPADSTNVLQFYGYKKIFAEGLMGYGSTISVFVFLITLIISIFYIKAIGSRLIEEKT